MALTIKWNMQGFRDLRTDPAVMDDLAKRSERIAAAAGEGFVAEPVEKTGGRVRGRAAVVSTTYQAAAAEARDHVLLKALDAGK